MFGWDFSKAAMTVFSRSSSTLAPTQPFSDTVVTFDAVSFLAEFGTEPPTIACDPDTRTTANSITVASKAPTASLLRINPPPWKHGAAPAGATMNWNGDSTAFQANLWCGENRPRVFKQSDFGLLLPRASAPPTPAARRLRSSARCRWRAGGHSGRRDACAR